MIELQRCPFCKPSTEINVEYAQWGVKLAVCSECGLYREIDIWNIRPIEDELRSQNDLLHDAVDTAKRSFQGKFKKVNELRPSINLIINMIDCAVSYQSGDSFTTWDRLAHAREEAVKIREVLKGIEGKW